MKAPGAWRRRRQGAWRCWQGAWSHRGHGGAGKGRGSVRARGGGGAGRREGEEKKKKKRERESIGTETETETGTETERGREGAEPSANGSTSIRRITRRKPHQPKPQHPAGTRGSTAPSANLWTVDRDPHHAGAQRGPAGCLGHVWCVRRQRTSREHFCPRVRAALRESVECPWIMSGRQEIKRATICRDHAAWDVGCLSISATQTKLARRRGVNLGRGWWTD